MTSLQHPGSENDSNGFGALRKQYAASRFGYSDEVFQFLRTRMGPETPSILDIGCGTGISTRALATFGGRVVGCDRDPRMIAIAQKTNPETIRYIVAAAEALPFGNHTFSAVTAFGSFQWFSPIPSTREAYRVLKRNGHLFVISKHDLGSFRPGWLRIMSPYFMPHAPPVFCTRRNIQDLLRTYEFTDIETREMTVTECFDLPRALSFLQSVWEWNLVPTSVKSNALEKLTTFCKNIMRKGEIQRPVRISIIAARKPGLWQCRSHIFRRFRTMHHWSRRTAARHSPA